MPNPVPVQCSVVHSRLIPADIGMFTASLFYHGHSCHVLGLVAGKKFHSACTTQFEDWPAQICQLSAQP